MGQYFKLLNVDEKEKVALPGGMKLLERVTNPVAMGMVGYLLFDGPLDGTGLAYNFEPDDERLEDGIEAYIERERHTEAERLREYLAGEKEHVINGFERKHGVSPEEEPAAFEAYCEKRARSCMRNDDGSWPLEEIVPIVASGFELNELYDYCGRWAGDDVRLVGDYAENDLYDESATMWRYEYEGEEFVARAVSSAPITPESIHRDDIEHSVERRDVEPGDYAHVQHPEKDEKVYAHYKGVAETEWTDITDGLTEEFVDVVGEDWVEEASEVGMMRPDMVLSV